MFQRVAFMRGVSALPASANEKMLNFAKRSGRYLALIEQDMGVHAYMPNCAIMGSAAPRKRVARLMREAGLCAKGKRHRVVTTRRDASHPVAPNLLNREFPAAEPNKKWGTDITYIPTAQGWLYLTVILDVYSRAVGGWSISASCDEELAAKALQMAIGRRCPQPGLLHHSDRGCQYTSRTYRQRLEQAGMLVSMSRTGNCWDNAAMESFFGSLKQECIANAIYVSHEQARLSLFEYLEVYYNRQRRHSSLGYVSPLTYEQFAKQRVERNVDVLRLS